MSDLSAREVWRGYRDLVSDLWRGYRDLVSDPATRFPMLVLTVLWIGCWAVLVYLLLTLGAI